MKDRWELFIELFPEINNQNTVLDFGCADGGLLEKGTLNNKYNNQSNYTGIDVCSEQLTIGKNKFPDANFILYDRWNSMYNTTGNINEPFPETNLNQDYVFSFSVFTHTDYNDMVETLNWLENFNYIKSAHSILDIKCKDTLEFFYNKRVKMFGSCENIVDIAQDPSINVMYLLDNNQVILNNKSIDSQTSDVMVTFYNIDWLQKELSTSIVTPVPNFYAEKHSFIIKDRQGKDK